MAKLIEFVTKSEKAYREIRQMISDGRLAPGEVLVQRTLGKRLLMSNIPIIDAFRRLEADGLIDRQPHGQAHVKAWNSRAHIERLIMREFLEGATARYCAMRITDKQVQELQKMSEQVDFFSSMEKAGVSHPELDAKFHLLIAKFSGLSLAEQELRRFSLLETTMSSGSKCPQVREDPEDQHRRIVDVIASRDGDLAERSMRDHLCECREWAISVAKERGFLKADEYLN